MNFDVGLGLILDCIKTTSSESVCELELGKMGYREKEIYGGSVTESSRVPNQAEAYDAACDEE